MNMLAIDAGFRNTGWAVVDVADGAVLASGVVATEKSAAKHGIRVADDNVRCVQEVVRALLALVRQHQVRGFAVEVPTAGGKSARAVASMAMALAVVGAVAEVTGLPAEWVTPMDNKKRLTGRKNASKEEMQAAVLAIYPQLRAEYTKNERLLGRFEHVADAVGAWLAVRDGMVVRTLRQKGV